MTRMRGRGVSLATILIASAATTFSGNATAAGQSTSPTAAAPPAYSVVRWDEDYSYLKDPAKRTDALDSLKYIPITDDMWLSLGGSARYRYEFFNHNNFGAGPQDDDGYSLTRLLFHADLHIDPNVRFFVQGKSAMEDGRTGGNRPSDADELDLQQGFGDLKLPFGEKSSATLRFGRQEMSYGAQRLIGPLDWANVQRTWDGGKVMIAQPNYKLDLFWVRPVAVEKEEFNDDDGNTSFAGAYYTRPLPDLIKNGGVKLEAYALALNQANPGPADTDNYTVGSRLTGAPKPWDFDIEADYQFGQFADESLSAYSLAMEVGYTFVDITLSPRPFLGFDIASGSADGSERFNQLFPTGHLHFGYIDVVGRQNIIDLHPGATLTLVKGVTFRADHHFFWRQNTNDALYSASGTVQRADTGSAAAYIGHEIDLTLNWQINRHTSLATGYSHFFTGDFIDQTGADQDIDFFYVSVNFIF